MTQRNLVEGGARRGTFQTRHNRIVRIKEPFTFTEPLEPGKAPVSRTCWKGDLFMGDGKTLDSEGIWEMDGSFQNKLGVIQRNDLVRVVSLDAEPEPQAQIAAAPQVSVAEADGLLTGIVNGLKARCEKLGAENARLREENAALLEQNTALKAHLMAPETAEAEV